MYDSVTYKSVRIRAPPVSLCSCYEWMEDAELSLVSLGLAQSAPRTELVLSSLPPFYSSCGPIAREISAPRQVVNPLTPLPRGAQTEMHQRNRMNKFSPLYLPLQSDSVSANPRLLHYRRDYNVVIVNLLIFCSFYFAKVALQLDEHLYFLIIPHNYDALIMMVLKIVRGCYYYSTEQFL